MGILASIFGKAETIDEIAKGAANGIDKLRFTEEEKSEASARLADWFLRYLETTNPQNLARRVIAFSVAGLWAFLVLLSVAAWVFSPAYAAYVFGILKDTVSVPFGIIIGFYFAAHIVRGWQQTKQ